MKTTTIIMLAICLMSFALAYYPGEQIEVPNEMGITNLVYTIVDNTTVISDLDIEINETNITITFPSDMPPTSFKIVFIEEQTKEVVQTVYRGGGGGGTKYVDRNVTVEVPVIQEKEVIKLSDPIVETKTITEPMSTKNKFLYIGIPVLLGMILVYFIMRKKKQPTAEELVGWN